MLKWILTLILSFYFSISHSQKLTAFNDYRKHFMVFENGVTKELDHLPAQSFQVGGDCIPFVANSGQFKVYYKGQVITLSEHTVSGYYASSCLLVFKVYDQLYVFDNGQMNLLASVVKNFAIGDSLVAYFDEIKYSSHVYYKGKIFDLERSLVGQPVVEFKIGDNLCAYYNNNTKYLKIFYNGKVLDILQSTSKIDYQAGRNILAYVDKSTNSFHLYVKGEDITLEDFEPKSMMAGDDLIAYIDNLGTFKVFYEGEIQTISPFEPDFYVVKDSLLVFAEQGYFKVFYRGRIHDLGNFIPEEYHLQESTLAFIDVNGWLQAFTNGEFIKVTNDLITSYSVDYNIICINTTVKKVIIFFNGKIYNTN